VGSFGLDAVAERSRMQDIQSFDKEFQVSSFKDLRRQSLLPRSSLRNAAEFAKKIAMIFFNFETSETLKLLSVFSY
jgi:hypothetical protein